MLNNLRNMMGGVVAKVLIGLLVISFAVWGASDAFIGGAATNTVTAGQTKVGLADYRLAYLSRVNGLQQQLGQRMSREQLQAFGIEQAVMGEVVAGAVLDETARRMGLGVSDQGLAQLIAEDPAFQDATGNFSRQNLEFALRQVGMRQEDYIENRRSAAVRDQLLAALSEDARMPDAFYNAYLSYLDQQRTFRYFVVESRHVEEPSNPTESQLREYYEANQGQYRAAENRDLVLVKLTAEDIADPTTISREAVEAEYERTKENYSTPESRRVQQLNFPDRAAAEKAAERLESGESYETIMEEMERTQEDVDLGYLKRSDLPDQNIANAAFDLEVGETSGVVDGIFGPVILKVTDIREGEVKPLEDVEGQIRELLARDQAADQIYDVHDRLEDERAAGDRLAEAARKVGLDPVILENVEASGRGPDGEPVDTDIPDLNKVLTEAFATDQGVEADPVSLGPSGFVWYEVTEVTDERQKTFEEVRAEVEEAWKQAETARKVEELAQQIRDRAAKGEALSEVVSDLVESSEGEETLVETTALMRRNDTGQDLVSQAVETGFQIAQGEVAVAPGPEASSRVVIQVQEVIEGNDATPPPEDLRNRLNSALGNDLTNTVISQLQSGMDVSINQQAIETAISY